MVGGVSPEIWWAIKKHCNNKFYYTVASCWFFLWDFFFSLYYSCGDRFYLGREVCIRHTVHSRVTGAWAILEWVILELEKATDKDFSYKPLFYCHFNTNPTCTIPVSNLSPLGMKTAANLLNRKVTSPIITHVKTITERTTKYTQASRRIQIMAVFQRSKIVLILDLTETVYVD
jgi:hypothetical protein